MLRGERRRESGRACVKSSTAATAGTACGLVLGIACVAVLAGCINVDTVHEYRGGQTLNPPGRIVVKDFAYAPEDVTLATGLAAQVSGGTDITPRTPEELELGKRVADALSRKLVEKLLDLGMNAQRFEGEYPPFDNIVVVEGQFTSIDQGNRAARVVIGLGFGKSEVRTHAQVYQQTPDKRRLLQEFTTRATSSYAPGLAVGLGVGAAAGTLATSAAVSGTSAVAGESLGADVLREAERTATKLVAEMKPFFIDHAWIPAYDS